MRNLEWLHGEGRLVSVKQVVQLAPMDSEKSNQDWTMRVLQGKSVQQGRSARKETNCRKSKDCGNNLSGSLLHLLGKSILVSAKTNTLDELS
jgi:hypothetical protein